MKTKPEFDSAFGVPRAKAIRWHERVLMGVVVVAMLLALIGYMRG